MLSISKVGIELIKSFEGLRLTSYKCLVTEKYYTIGYGHYGPDVRFAQKITKEEAERLLLNDIKKFEANVNKYDHIYHWSQQELDALISFAYNIGSIDQLTANGSRSKNIIAEKMLLYVNSGGRKIPALVERRKKEYNLFKSTIDDSKDIKPLNIAKPTLRTNCKGDNVKILQNNLNTIIGSDLVEDGIYGKLTKAEVKKLQTKCNITVDGIYGPISYNNLCMLALKEGYYEP